MRVLTALFLFITAALGAQTQSDVHYRWQEKIDATHLSDTSMTTRRSRRVELGVATLPRPTRTSVSREIPANSGCTLTAFA